MTAFDDYVNQILKNNKQLTNLRLTVEKEIFHQDILRLISVTSLNKSLVFMGGTCLRLCYGSERLSEDLDFCTDVLILQNEAEQLSETIREGLYDKYHLSVTVSKPEKDSDTETWKISIVTHPEHSHMPTQKIHLDICHYETYLKELRLVKNIYGIGGTPLFVMAEKIEEILVDKLIAFSFRNRIKNRDLWDIYSLYCREVALNKDVLKWKIRDKGYSYNQFITAYTKRTEEIENSFPADFSAELSRFISPGVFESSRLSKTEGPAVFNTILSDYKIAF